MHPKVSYCGNTSCTGQEASVIELRSHTQQNSSKLSGRGAAPIYAPRQSAEAPRVTGRVSYDKNFPITKAWFLSPKKKCLEHLRSMIPSNPIRELEAKPTDGGSVRKR